MRQRHTVISAHAGKTAHSSQRRSPGRRHLRSRGENGPNTAENIAAYGSSPLTRGKPDATMADMLTTRLIPAHAGKTHCVLSHKIHHQAHPRSRGENPTTGFKSIVVFGSSPLTRGKLPGHVDRPGVYRLIPAHAGKTAYNTPPSHHARAHPRSRGENIGGFIKTSDSSGSSPLTRGKHRRDGDRLRLRRLIPAHAGKTVQSTPKYHRGPAHPRSRGENLAASPTPRP